jgi:hypothetical protein
LLKFMSSYFFTLLKMMKIIAINNFLIQPNQFKFLFAIMILHVQIVSFKYLNFE